MEKIMSKTNDTEKTRELNDAELAAVTGGVVNAAVAGAIKGAVWGEFRPKTTGCYRPYRATLLTSSAP
jgi:bacteriocin-like protein